MTTPESGVLAISGDLIQELMGTVVSVDFVLTTLMELPADALPGENRAEAIRELLSASACREVERVGEDACRAAIALIVAVVDRIADDAQALADLAGAAGQRAC